MNLENIDSILIPTHPHENEQAKDRYMDHLLEQYRIYIHIFNSNSELRHRYNEFFLGLNTAIMGIIGYFEIKDLPNEPVVFTLVPILGMAICFCWYRIVLSFTQLNRAKFKIIHTIEAKLPASLFKTEWHLLGKGKDVNTYYPLSHVEKNIPIIFIVLYLIIFLVNFPVFSIFHIGW